MSAATSGMEEPHSPSPSAPPTATRRLQGAESCTPQTSHACKPVRTWNLVSQRSRSHRSAELAPDSCQKSRTLGLNFLGSQLQIYQSTPLPRRRCFATWPFPPNAWTTYPRPRRYRKLCQNTNCPQEKPSANEGEKQGSHLALIAHHLLAFWSLSRLQISAPAPSVVQTTAHDSIREQRPRNTKGPSTSTYILFGVWAYGHLQQCSSWNSFFDNNSIMFPHLACFLHGLG
ncbi:hypothetical protein B0J11DRAFT_221456 [Dendryphion nanum]|uniref:Uncharacterized protein n=1 Tax=Dendryphion nanum TaxID=256645 RepID=A0A9P9ITX8_9PLEO|nr:hypothetical protein B0J11DRAFT_221456 [Dendryphion nanum]